MTTHDTVDTVDTADVARPSDAAAPAGTSSGDGGPTPASLDWTTRLMSLDTTSRLTNLPVIELVAEELRGHGVEPVLIHDDSGQKANLLATFPAADGTTTGGVVLSGHTDVVPVDGQEWSSEPFVPQVRDGRLYGRGACDMKGFIGSVLTAVPALAAASLSEPVHLALSYDEEVGCVGAVSLVDEIVRRDLRPRACIVGEPTSMRVVTGHKSLTMLAVTFHGVAAHSSRTPFGVNAIEHAAQLVRFVRGVADEFRTDGPFDENHDVPFTTATVNQIHGGIAVNTVPVECSLTFEFRAVGGVDVDATVERFRTEIRRIEQEMQQENPDASVEVAIGAQAPGLDTDAAEEVIAYVASLGGIASEEKVAYGTEAGLFQRAGIPTVVCGPGDIAQAHAPDEFVELDQLRRCDDLVQRLLGSLSA
ncbi:acetylornithine deacetylase [Terracoccus luteus]|uniref:Acetylornithine deacetylase n=1 Tax=Terracoccus luteus TaxID=53356 RepID=A0A839Q1T5_9MICO|nr:acetylornithine deacetylase [Terracoccus luteus]MBB2988226.1 acetylornithine deacetylase [Terracoccus luteus]MCP2173861.1 acetylornithine deacetylase [Terracoccus luteus]